MSMLIAAAILVSAPAVPADRVDAAYDDLAAHRDSEAIARIETSTRAAADHPASQINLGVAYARQGDAERAREAFERAARSDARYHLETAAGNWVDSRQLAQRALAALERGDLAAPTRTARR